MASLLQRIARTFGFLVVAGMAVAALPLVRMHTGSLATERHHPQAKRRT